MALPASFAAQGFVEPRSARKRMKLKNGAYLKPLIIGTEGDSDTGKTEFGLSCPGPGIVICLDRGFDGIFDNPNPPTTRHDNFGFKAISVPMNTTVSQDVYTEYFKLCRREFYAALDNLDALTVIMDGDSDFYELQTLAEFGKKTQIWPQTRFGDLYAKRRAIAARAWDSGKIIVYTNKLKDQYETVYDAAGKPVLETNGEEKRIKTGLKERQGFRDYNYLITIQLRHLYKAASVHPKTRKPTPAQWGLEILKCKPNTSLVGTELWGSECNFETLVQVVYPDVPLTEWGL